MRGNGKCPARVNNYEVFWSWVGAFLGIAAVGILHEMFFEDRELVMIIGSFGASAVLFKKISRVLAVKISLQPEEPVPHATCKALNRYCN
ncbi:MAG: hypothetical protein D5R98_02545 [Desulfonatronovibrio sp. MSAO_Bac4]|nr:MAG: hypothetical protein D5R98_02545 [Desulfonatronovibrio sp. MSAO_Bac4]